jgi:folate-dependent phosphoribosylglycinamide formyltransferase PurN
MDLSVVIITGNQLRHNYFVNRLGEHFDLRGVVSESVYQPVVEGEPRDKSDLERHFREREQAESRYFASDSAMNVDPAQLLRIPKGEANSDVVFDWITSQSPQMLVLYGSSIIRERMLTVFDRRVINMHLGLSPYYRGSGTNFWPLVNGEPELVGVTIHLATLDVDAGAILKQVRPEIAREDRNHDIGCKAIMAGTQAMIEAITGYATNSITPQPQPQGGKLYRRKDFNVQAVRKMWRNFDEGMIEAYLSNPERAQRFPIIE